MPFGNLPRSSKKLPFSLRIVLPELGSWFLVVSMGGELGSCYRENMWDPHGSQLGFFIFDSANCARQMWQATHLIIATFNVQTFYLISTTFRWLDTIRMMWQCLRIMLVQLMKTSLHVATYQFFFNIVVLML